MIAKNFKNILEKSKFLMNNGNQYRFSTAGYFSKDIKILERGQIPETLKYDRPLQQTTLPNGIVVASEYWPSPISTISVNIMCGSRNETAETSGTAHFLEHLHFKGTKKRSRLDLEIEIENIGGQLNAYTSRENTSYTMNLFKNKIEHGIEILGDILGNSLYTEQAVISERDTIYRELLETSKQQMETTVEISHRGTYKDHQMGLPILGKINNIFSITRENVVEYHKNNYFGENIMIVAAGNHNHEQLCDYVNKYFGNFPQKSPQDPKELESQQRKPVFNNELFMMKGDVTNDINIGMFYEGPSWMSSHYYNFLLIQRILGEKPSSQAEQELNNCKIIFNKLKFKQIRLEVLILKNFVIDSNLNKFQQILNGYPNIHIQKSIYTPYKDTGLFGNYFHGELDCLPQTISLSKQIFQEYALNLTDEEIEKAKRTLYIELLQHETGNDLSQAIGTHLQYFNRRIYRSELAYRISSMTKKDIIDDMKTYLIDKPFSVTIWGNVDSLMESLQSQQS
ncbi:Metalloenzyme, LuxS/M16 peptidase-like protein [Pseudocohnilembus persalinus]|uniref:Metalloenzyme, LuxS/M16 peptidase-like protein n=1 Tax=Pseudocohnilembus persalinus TaxID=266149 RepID=A0A0V0Q8T8_PSEPJ|nr:Metalloenzyme, LuxS/M16 peptidase-like protein [Pseudocohnilembus persalinus]|eukprot:KRW98652.1 Metalloenzyme, LuxS/M16 peptidase-like protein [Pseudocohnilembus persalinus]